MKAVLVGTFSGGFVITALLAAEQAENLAIAMRKSGKMAEAVAVESPIGRRADLTGTHILAFGGIGDGVELVGPFEEENDAYEFGEKRRRDHQEYTIFVVQDGTDQGEILPGATRSEIMEIMMQDIVGNYVTPDTVPEWAWVQEHASFSHSKNGQDGIWEFVLNIANAEYWKDIPEKLAPVIKKAQADAIAYLIVHQGT